MASTANLIPTKTKRSLLAACLAAGVAVSAWAAVKQDNFDNSAIAAIWTATNHGTTKVTEANGRLCFRSTSDTAGLRRAYYASNGWTYRGHESAVITFDYKLDVAGLSGSEYAAIGVYTPEPDDDTSLEVQIVQKASGRFLEYRLFVDEGSGLDQVDFKSAPLPAASGSIEIRYNKTADKMIIKVDGTTKITINNLNSGYGPFDLDVELFGKAKMAAFTNAKAWIDNFKVQGVID